jgi:hypothetical protein
MKFKTQTALKNHWAMRALLQQSLLAIPKSCQLACMVVFRETGIAMLQNHAPYDESSIIQLKDRSLETTQRKLSKLSTFVNK